MPRKAVKAEAVDTAVETKAEETVEKAPEKKAVAKKSTTAETKAVKEPKATKTAAKAPAKEADTAKEAAPKKAPAKKAAAKKAAEPQVTVTVQLQGKEDIVAAQVVEAAKKAYAEVNPDAEIKTIDIYMKPEEGVAYYAVNGEGSADYKVEL